MYLVFLNLYTNINEEVTVIVLGENTHLSYFLAGRHLNMWVQWFHTVMPPQLSFQAASIDTVQYSVLFVNK